MSATAIALALSLAVLAGLLAILSAQGIARYRATRARVQLAWSAGLLLATAAMVIETLVFAGWVSSALLAAYVFLSAAIVGVLSLGAVRVFRSPRVERLYSGFVVGACALLAGACGLVPSPSSMVNGGVITGNPAPILLVLSSLITFPATAVLLTASAIALRRARKWPTLLMIAGALILGAGGTLYIASFPVALYYAEFLGIVLLFAGLIHLPHPVTGTAPTPAAPASN